MHIDLDDSVNNVGTAITYGIAITNNFANAGDGTTKAYGLIQKLEELIQIMIYIWRTPLILQSMLDLE